MPLLRILPERLLLNPNLPPVHLHSLLLHRAALIHPLRAPQLAPPQNAPTQVLILLFASFQFAVLCLLFIGFSPLLSPHLGQTPSWQLDTLTMTPLIPRMTPI